ncbi:hypothetical protein B0H11DRAFT_2046666 [Mycena galericulata]|nr:hypothetical protein B0H11DRAFT_2046666 [Mycena galericulata]
MSFFLRPSECYLPTYLHITYLPTYFPSLPSLRRPSSFLNTSASASADDPYRPTRAGTGVWSVGAVRTGSVLFRAIDTSTGSNAPAPAPSRAEPQSQSGAGGGCEREWGRVRGSRRHVLIRFVFPAFSVFRFLLAFSCPLSLSFPCALFSPLHHSFCCSLVYFAAVWCDVSRGFVSCVAVCLVGDWATRLFRYSSFLLLLALLGCGAIFRASSCLVGDWAGLGWARGNHPAFLSSSYRFPSSWQSHPMIVYRPFSLFTL